MIPLDPYERVFIFTLLWIHALSLAGAIIFHNIVALRAPKGEVKRYFLLIHRLIMVWLIGKMLKTVSPVLILRWGSNVLYYMGILPLGPAFFLLARSLAGKKTSPAAARLFFLPSGIFFLFLVTNPFHYLFYRVYTFASDRFGPVFYVHFGLTFLFSTAAIITLLVYALKNRDDRIKALLLLMGALFPLLINLQYILDFLNPMFDITPIVYNLSLILLGIGAFKFDFFNFIPQAVQSALGNLPGKITLGSLDYGADKEQSLELNLYDRYSIALGKRSLTIQRYVDINSIREKQKQISQTTEKISRQNEMITRLITARRESYHLEERAYLAGYVHDIFGYTISSIIATLETCRYSRLTGSDYKKRIELAISEAEKGLKELSHRVYLEDERDYEDDFYQLLAHFSNHDFRLTLFINPIYLTKNLDYENFYFILKESFTNIIKHSKAKEVTIGFEHTDNRHILHIVDDGIGCGHIQYHSGLTHMKEKVEKLGGSLSFYSESGAGFHTRLALPPKSPKKQAQKQHLRQYRSDQNHQQSPLASQRQRPPYLCRNTLPYNSVPLRWVPKRNSPGPFRRCTLSLLRDLLQSR